jgi:hypothetical protein
MTVASELERVRKINAQGRVTAQDVVDFASAHPKSALYEMFEWNDTEAGKAYRLIQAQRIIRSIIIHPPHVEQAIRAYVSIPSHRLEPGGGYTPVAVALTNDAWREQLYEQALAEIRRWRDKYAMLQTLAGVFAAIDALPDPEPRKKPPESPTPTP